MARHVALLRGINVGPTTKVPMAELKAALEDDLGFTQVKTLLNSGNAVFSADAKPDQAKIEAALKARFFPIDVVLRSAKQIEQVLAHDPFAKEADDESRYFVAFLSEKPKKQIDEAVAAAQGKELASVKGTELYVWSPDGVLKSKVLEALPKTKAVDHATVRNWRTIKKIAAAF